MSDKSKEVEALIDKAVKADKSEDALRFSQAACKSSHVSAAITSSLLSGSNGKICSF